jgi:hypothetical protein
LVLKGVVRAERLDNPTDFIPHILARVKPEYVRKQYGISEWSDATDFIAQLARKTGKLMKGGEMDLNNVAVSMINDFQRVSDCNTWPFSLDTFVIFELCDFYIRVNYHTLCRLCAKRKAAMMKMIRAETGHWMR